MNLKLCLAFEGAVEVALEGGLGVVFGKVAEAHVRLHLRVLLMLYLRKHSRFL